MKDIYLNHIAEHLGVKVWQVENCAQMFAEGNTIPFIRRSRKERTGGLDDVAVAEIKHWTDVFSEMEKRKVSIISTIQEAGKLTPELSDKIDKCIDSAELEDLYLPYRPKRKTKATVAIAAGLEPLADKMFNVSLSDPASEAKKYLNDKVPSVEDALSGARDIIAERLSETASLRENLRAICRCRRIVSHVSKTGEKSQEASKYRSYFNFSMPIANIPSHN